MKKTEFDDYVWVCTDPDCNQYRKDTDNPKVFLFKEDREVNPETDEIKPYSTEIDLNDYTIEEMVDYCLPYGYEEDDVIRWYAENMNLDLIAECIFEQDYDEWILN